MFLVAKMLFVILFKSLSLSLSSVLFFVCIINVKLRPRPLRNFLICAGIYVPIVFFHADCFLYRPPAGPFHAPPFVMATPPLTINRHQSELRLVRSMRKDKTYTAGLFLGSMSESPSLRLFNTPPTKAKEV